MIKQLALVLCIGSLLSLPACKECCSKKNTEETTQTYVDTEVTTQENQNCSDASCDATQAPAEESVPAKF